MKLYFYFLSHIIFSFVLSFQLNAQDFFHDMAGWKKSDQTHVYKPETLYEYIDGAAELYLNYNFKELKVAEYHNENNASVIIEVYRHQTANDAFGIYSQERPTKGQFLTIGAQGYLEPPILNFLMDNFYVKISGYDITENTAGILKSLAEQLAANLGEKSSLPIILQCFPDSGKIQNSEKFMARSFLGHGFLHSGFIADYVVDKKSFQLFIIAGADSSDCREMLGQYFQLGQISISDLKEDRYTISDPYHGEIMLSWRERYIWGVLHLDDKSNKIEYLKRLEELIRTYIENF